VRSVWLQIFQHILVTDRSVLSMFKTFGLHSKWRNIERHWKCILTALWLLSKYSLSIPTSFHIFWSHSRENLLYPWPHSLHQLIKHGKLNPEVVVERLSVFYSELIHQSGVMSIQPPPHLCQPWTGLISSGSTPPLSFPGLLHISFKQILRDDSNLDLSNIDQRVTRYFTAVD